MQCKAVLSEEGCPAIGVVYTGHLGQLRMHMFEQLCPFMTHNYVFLLRPDVGLRKQDVVTCENKC